MKNKNEDLPTKTLDGFRDFESKMPWHIRIELAGKKVQPSRPFPFFGNVTHFFCQLEHRHTKFNQGTSTEGDSVRNGTEAIRKESQSVRGSRATRPETLTQKKQNHSIIAMKRTKPTKTRR
jgi:hypothetical protein